MDDALQCEGPLGTLFSSQPRNGFRQFRRSWSIVRPQSLNVVMGLHHFFKRQSIFRGIADLIIVKVDVNRG